MRLLFSTIVHRRSVRGALFFVLGLAVVLGCRTESDPVQSHLRGTITVRAAIDSTGDYGGFRVLVVDANGRTLDTLGRAITETDGTFETGVTAPERGIYALTLWGRQGQQRLASTDYVVADGDSGRLEVELPVDRGRLRVRSDENAALMAYRNTLAQHRRTVLKQLRAETVDSTALDQSVRQTSSILWSLQDTFPGTYASQLAAVESLSLLGGRSDSLVVARAESLEPSNPRYIDALRMARQAETRRHGQDAALKLLTEFEDRAATNEQRAAVQSLRVRAFIDSMEAKAALSAAQRLKNQYPDTRWAEWADRAMYEVNNLLPGSDAPSFRARTVDGDSLSLGGFQGRPVVLEYFRPGNTLYARQLPTRNALYRSTRADSVAFVSISVDPDTLVYQAFADGRTFPGHSVIAPAGLDDSLVTTYNVADLPTRVLINADGQIVGRYPGTAFLTLQEDLTQLLQESSVE